jgi:threonine dehydrogenase-like Zn-dependent dehydrogenase
MENDKSSPNQVQIKINVGGLCYSDIHITKRGITFSPQLFAYSWSCEFKDYDGTAEQNQVVLNIH